MKSIYRILYLIILIVMLLIGCCKKEENLNLASDNIIENELIKEESLQDTTITMDNEADNKISEIYYTPIVFAVENNYQIIFMSNEKGMAWVKIGDEIYYDSVSGLIRSDSVVHKVTVPQYVLDEAKAYTVGFQIVYERTAYYPQLGEIVEQEYAFRPIDFSDGLQIHAVSDTHNCVIEEPTAAYEYFGVATDFIIHAGDVVDSMDEEISEINSYSKFIETMSILTKGEIPAVYARGNHEVRGLISDQYYRVMPVVDDKTYYTFRIGELYGIVLDFGEDKIDSHAEYTGTICFEDYRRAQTDFLKSVIENKEEEYEAEGINYRIGICHIPFSAYSQTHDLECSNEWKNLISEMKLDIVLGGHYHKYTVFDNQKLPHRDLVITNGPVGNCIEMKNGICTIYREVEYGDKSLKDTKEFKLRTMEEKQQILEMFSK